MKDKGNKEKIVKGIKEKKSKKGIADRKRDQDRNQTPEKKEMKKISNRKRDPIINQTPEKKEMIRIADRRRNQTEAGKNDNEVVDKNRLLKRNISRKKAEEQPKRKVAKTMYEQTPQRKRYNNLRYQKKLVSSYTTDTGQVSRQGSPQTGHSRGRR